MLILTRKPGESLTIGSGIRVTILEVRGKQVRLGIEAPPDILVLREELLQRLAQDNLRATGFASADVAAVLQQLGQEWPGSWGLGTTPPDVAAIKVDSPTFGRLVVPEEAIINFPEGLPGLEKSHAFVLLEDPRTAPFGFLQCVNAPCPCLVVADPAKVKPDHRFTLSPRILQDLESDNTLGLLVRVILSIPPGRPQEMTANLQCPILINRELRRGKQVIMEGPHYSYKCRFLEPCGQD